LKEKRIKKELCSFIASIVTADKNYKVLFATFSFKKK